MKPKMRHRRLDPKKNPELLALSGLVGEFIEYWGFKSVQGRMWCYLFLIKDPLNSRQLAELLDISPALVTQSIQILLRYRVVVEESEKGPNGVLRFRANPKVAEAISTVLAERERALIEKIRVAQDKLECSEKKRSNLVGRPELDLARVEQVGKWATLAGLFLEGGLLSLSQSGNPFEDPEAFRSLVEFKL